MLRWVETKDWEDAFHAIIPKRKFQAGKKADTGTYPLMTEFTGEELEDLPDACDLPEDLENVPEPDEGESLGTATTTEPSATHSSTLTDV